MILVYNTQPNETNEEFSKRISKDMIEKNFVSDKEYFDVKFIKDKPIFCMVFVGYISETTKRYLQKGVVIND